MDNLLDVTSLCFDLEEQLQSTEDPVKRSQHIRDHIGGILKLKCICPDFAQNLEWMNIDTPLSLRTSLQGKVVILDFFTYCCINCMHVLPDLEEVEKTYSIEDGVVIIGVHSAKFDTEKLSANIRSAILRYGISHPVVNDDSAVMWEQLSIQCWPTFIVLGPHGELLNIYVGEGHRNKLLEFVEESLKYYKEMDAISSHNISLTLERERQVEGPLSFPGNVCCSTKGEKIALSDSGHHRILVLDKTGHVQNCFGGKLRGFNDGSETECRFSSPQGLTFGDEDTIYVADTENHAIRKICLRSNAVTTLVGTGHQGTDKKGGKQGTDQEISSPWDIVCGCSPGSDVHDILFIAMAGTHQIWVYFLQDASWYKKREYTSGICMAFAGNGNEENRNNSYPDKAAFAQPSGLAISTHNQLNTLFVADSESSSIRCILLKDGAVKPFVGAERDPKNLFAYGNKDGIGIEAKLKHPLGVALVTDITGPLLIADTYNSQIKSVDIKSKLCSTFGGDSSNFPVHIKLNEPSGLCVDQMNQLAYIADTNNHDIKVINLHDNSVTVLKVEFHQRKELKKNVKKNSVIKGKVKTIDPLSVVHTDVLLTVKLHIILPKDSYINAEAPSKWTLYVEDSGEENLLVIAEGSITDLVIQNDNCIISNFSLTKTDDDKFSLYVKCKVIYCDADSTCKMSEVVLQQELMTDVMSDVRQHTIGFNVSI